MPLIDMDRWKLRSVRQVLRLSALLGVMAFGVPSQGQTQAQAKAAPDPRRPAALALEQQGKMADAAQQWRAILKSRPADPEPMAHIAVIEAHQGHYKQAIPLYRRALEINPNVPNLRLDLALALFKDGQLKESIPEFEALRKSSPSNSPDSQRATILMGMAYYGLADYPHAATYLKEAADANPNNLELLLALEHSYLWSHQFKYVLDVYHQILTLNPDSAEADMIAGEALDEMKDNAAATEMFRAAVKADPRQPNAHFALGYLLWTQKSYPEAAQEFNAELANDPKHVQSLVYLADSDIQMNKMDEATPLLQSVVKLDPGVPLAHVDLGIVAAEAGRNEEALREFLIAENKIPNDVNVHWRLARLYRTMGRKDEAKAEFDKASTLNKKADDDLFKVIEESGKRHASPASMGAPQVIR